MLDAVKETLAQVQDNLRSAGRVEEALHLNKFIQQNEQLREKGKNGVLQTEQFDLSDHLDAVNAVLEKYKEYLTKPEAKKEKKLTMSFPGLIVPTTEELYGKLV